MKRGVCRLDSSRAGSEMKRNAQMLPLSYRALIEFRAGLCSGEWQANRACLSLFTFTFFPRLCSVLLKCFIGSSAFEASRLDRPMLLGSDAGRLESMPGRASARSPESRAEQPGLAR